MDDLPTITAFFGWCTVVNIGIYIITALILTVFRSGVSKLHAKLSGVPAESLNKAYFNYLAFYKIIILSLNIAPYAALRLMAA